MRAPVWIFDLDNTLHNASFGVFPHINREMTAFIMRHLGLGEAAACELRELYWQQYGATLKGLALHHGIAPQDFLRETHPLDALLSLLLRERHVAEVLRRLPGRKMVLSNGPRAYVEAVLDHLQLSRFFEAALGAECMNYCAKPHVAGFRAALSHLGVSARDCVMVEDSLANLRQAKRLGMRTIWLASSVQKPAFVDFKISHLRELLKLPLV